MAASKRKQRRKMEREARRKKIASQSALNQTPLHQRNDRHKLVAMTLASLVAGLLAIVNLDRATHAGSLSKEERMLSTSRHGWPLVYLERGLEKKPQFFFSKRLYSWPIPAVEGEQRSWNFGNLAGNVGVGVSIVLAAYASISFIVFRYDRWKNTLRTE